jgi:hypothetical protein
MDYKLAFLISGAGYGINILVLIIISAIIWLLSLSVQADKRDK